MSWAGLLVYANNTYQIFEKAVIISGTACKHDVRRGGIHLITTFPLIKVHFLFSGKKEIGCKSNIG